MSLLRPILFAATALALAASPALAGPRDDILKGYAAAAKAADPSFTGFSADRGKAFYLADHTGGHPETPSCSTCHGKNPAEPGKTRTGKSIDPMAVSVSTKRFTDYQRVEKWFGRECQGVLGRECTAQEKGDFIKFLASR